MFDSANIYIVPEQRKQNCIFNIIYDHFGVLKTPFGNAFVCQHFGETPKEFSETAEKFFLPPFYFRESAFW